VNTARMNEVLQRHACSRSSTALGRGQQPMPRQIPGDKARKQYLIRGIGCCGPSDEIGEIVVRRTRRHAAAIRDTGHVTGGARLPRQLVVGQDGRDDVV